MDNREKYVKQISLKSLKKEFREQWRKESFVFLIIISLLVLIDMIFIKRIPFYPSLIIIGIWIIAYFYYERLNKEIWNKKDRFEKGYFWITFFVVLILEIIFGLLTFGKSNQIALNTIAILIIFGFFMLLCILISWQFYSLYHSKKSILLIIINYILLSLLLIIFFAGLFIPSNSSCGVLDNTNKTIINDVKGLLYFSSGNFYTLSYGDLIPICDKYRFISQIEVVISFILHVIIISHILSTPSSKQPKKK
ncbi:MAG: hypothetical protein Q7R52_01985 [archaeon]|nr:hypothetical protein [archaeon]